MQWTPISKRAEWKDVTPLPQNDGEHPVVPIDYEPDFREAMDYFRAVLAVDERSKRALELTAEVIGLNAANYTVWQYRRRLLDALGEDLAEELDYIDELAEDNPKNYQLWYHRRACAAKLGSPVRHRELEFTSAVLKLDSKNYHAWSYRQWVMSELGGWEGELAFCDSLLQEDLRNNSAWNQRFYVVSRSPRLGGLPAMRSAEVEYTGRLLLLAPSNESPWRYLRGLFGHDMAALAAHQGVRHICQQALEALPNCVHALSLLLDICSAPGGLEAVIAIRRLSQGEEEQNVASELCENLGALDPMRARYWQYRKQRLTGSSV